MSAFTVEQSGRFTATKRAVDTWPAAVAAAKEFIHYATLDDVERAELLSAVERAAGEDAVQLPNGKRLEIIYND
ncbi:hypothetical protein J2X12_002877 [Pseudarthrobacter oxydans]|uniref:Uncharacterized protein n=1 Tax=Pseudarthrobacter oxydans TaxID=1671 RepID=A0AAW8NE29_PSEOX|nr:hypothetical protein [Pseudarthrobacter oxydans]MDR6794386.1 hypothetical protein [Pseudarthrobacter oxydans]MDR7164839.1 hypothetical protein [Pseudarthrobacter oxydans]